MWKDVRRRMWVLSSLCDIQNSQLDDYPCDRIAVAFSPSLHLSHFDRIFRLSDYEERFDCLLVVGENGDFEYAQSRLSEGSTLFYDELGVQADLKPMISSDKAVSPYAVVEDKRLIYKGPIGEHKSRLIHHIELHRLLKKALMDNGLNGIRDANVCDAVSMMSLGTIDILPSTVCDGPDFAEDRKWAWDRLLFWVGGNLSYRLVPAFPKQLVDYDYDDIEDVLALANIWKCIIPYFDEAVIQSAKDLLASGWTIGYPFDESTRDLDAIAMLSEEAERTGLTSYLDAYFSGVPIEDIVA